MKTKNQTLRLAFKKTSKLLLTTAMVLCISAGWVLGSLTTTAFSQSTEKSINLPSLSMGGEKLPTILLDEFSVIADNK